MNPLIEYFYNLSTVDALKMYANDVSYNFFQRMYIYSKLLADRLLTEIKDDVVRSISSLREEIVSTNSSFLIYAFNETFHELNIAIVRRGDQAPITMHDTFRDFTTAAQRQNLRRPTTLYDDEHNVHAVVSSEMIDAANAFVAKYPAPRYRRRPFNHAFFNMIERNQTYNDGKLNVLALFSSVYRYVETSSKCRRSELRRRLCEELNDSVGTCLTGHVCRLINVLRGFVVEFDDVTVSPYEYYRSKTFAKLGALIDVYDTTNMLTNIERIVNSGQIDIQHEFIVSVLNEYTSERWYCDAGAYRVRRS